MTIKYGNDILSVVFKAGIDMTKKEKEIIKTVSDLYVNGIEFEGLTIKEALEKWEQVCKQKDQEKTKK